MYRSKTHHAPQGLASIAKMTSLTALTLCDCNAITGNGLGALSALTSLEALSVVRCNQVPSGSVCSPAVFENMTSIGSGACLPPSW